MAIFGNFQDFPPSEALLAVAQRTGTFLARLPARTVGLQLHGGRLLGYSENGSPVRDPLALTERFQFLLEQREGEFEFLPQTAAGPRRYIAPPLDQLISNALGASMNMNLTDEDLPSEQTRFLPTGCEDVWLEEDLQIFWERAERYFRDGASALQLSGCTGVTVRKARWFLLRLRAAGLVRPRRASEATEFSLPTRVQKAMELPPATSAAQADLSRIEVARPAQGLIRKLAHGLSALFGGFLPTRSPTGRA